MRLLDTASGLRREFPGRTPAEDPVVRMYACGITPYDATHLGHAVTFSVFDVIQRRLLDLGFQPRYVRNVTDVDDGLLARAAELGVHHLDLAAGELAAFDRDLDCLGFRPAWSEPRATSAIGDIRRLVGALLDAGHAYRAGGHVWLSSDAVDLTRFGDRPLDELLALGRARGERTDLAGRRAPLDTVLWQASAEGEPEWEARWGPGRPGWHVECAALTLRELGGALDLHGGGDDLAYPHHTFEAAQAELVDGRPLATHWLHVAEVRLDGERMSKSEGNLVLVRDLCEAHDSMAVRLAVLDGRYTEPREWTDAVVRAAEDRLAAWRGTVGRPEGDGLAHVRDALDDDLDLPAALQALDAEVERGRGVAAGAALLGVRLI